MNATKEFIKKFQKLCEEYAYEDIDTGILKKEIINIIDNYSG